MMTVGLLLCSGWLYRKTAFYLHLLSQVKVMPNIPLEQFPYTLGSWEGIEYPISETVLKVAANDDYLSRVYVDNIRQLQATLYVAYTAEPRRMLGHRPRVCYVGSGWIHDGTRTAEFETVTGVKRPCQIHQFHKTGLNYQDIFVLNYYVVNGVITIDESAFSGLRWRRPKISSGRIDYVAQVQISSISEVAVQTLAREFTREILSYFPADSETD